MRHGQNCSVRLKRLDWSFSKRTALEWEFGFANHDILNEDRISLDLAIGSLLSLASVTALDLVLLA
jgi:hypothetical protein